MRSERVLAPDGSTSIARVNEARLEILCSAVVAHIHASPPIEPVNRWRWHPRAGEPLVVEYYLLTLAHQFAFWEITGGEFSTWRAQSDAGELSGSDFVWYTMHRLFRDRPEVFDPGSPLFSTSSETAALRDARGQRPPRWSAHEEISHALRIALSCPLVQRQLAPSYLLEGGIGGFERVFGALPGYCEDPLKKRLNLLFMYLTAREDNPLGTSPHARVTPAIDYHLQRLLLRAGVVEVIEESCLRMLVGRHALQGAEEMDIRAACHAAVATIVERSDFTSFQIDQALFALRQTCAYDHHPRCSECWLCPSCAQRTALFQPLLPDCAWY